MSKINFELICTLIGRICEKASRGGMFLLAAFTITLLVILCIMKLTTFWIVVSLIVICYLLGELVP